MNKSQNSTVDTSGYNRILGAKAQDRILSARTLLPLITKTFSPRSMLDVGCGFGAWLQVARELGVESIQGVDGPWIDQESLVIPKQNYLAHPLDTSLDLKMRFDVVISLEVAEHVPAGAADVFVENLVRHGDIVLFSAAIPFQGGHGHVNEQWPGYWAERFKGHGYHVCDVVRPLIWGSEAVFWWLQQNTLLFLNNAALSRFPDFSDDVVEDFNTLAMVHPHLYMRWISHAQG